MQGAEQTTNSQNSKHMPSVWQATNQRNSNASIYIRDLVSNICSGSFSIIRRLHRYQKQGAIATCIRWVNRPLANHEDFFGLYNIPGVNVIIAKVFEMSSIFFGS